MIRIRPALVPSLVVIILVTIAVMLGNWQAERHIWKENLLSDMRIKFKENSTLLPIATLRLKGQPSPILGEDAGLELLKRHDSTLVKVMGHFLKYPLFFRVAKHPYLGSGFEVVAAFKAKEGVIPVVMGIIPADKKDKFLPPKKDMTIYGMLRLPEKNKNQDVPSGGLIGQVPMNIYLKQFGEELLPNYMILTQQNKFDNNIITKHTDQFVANIPNNHFLYMWTWFLLAGTLIVIYIVWHYQTGRLAVGKKK